MPVSRPLRRPSRIDRPSATLAALRHREFRLLFAGLLPAGIGFWMQEFVLGWLAIQLAIRDGEPALGGLYLGLRSFASAVPSLGVGLFAGVLADRLDRRALLIATRLASAAVAALLVLLILADGVSIGVLMLLSAAASAAYVFDPPARQAILPRLVPLADLFSAMGLVRAALQSAHTLGPLVAGLLIVPFGVSGVMIAMCALVLLSVATLVPLRAQPAASAAREVGMLGSLGEGFGHLWRDDLLRWCVILQIIFAILGQAFMQLLPAIAVDTLGVGAQELSWMTAAVGLGALIGALFIASVGRVERLGRLLLGMMIAVGVLLMALGAQRGVAGTIALLLTLGILHQLFMGAHAVILQLTSPDHLRGRVMGTQSVVFMSVMPLGVLIVGTLGTLIGISTAIAISGGALCVVGLTVGARVPVVSGLLRSTAMRAAAERAVRTG